MVSRLKCSSPSFALLVGGFKYVQVSRRLKGSRPFCNLRTADMGDGGGTCQIF